MGLQPLLAHDLLLPPGESNQGSGPGNSQANVKQLVPQLNVAWGARRIRSIAYVLVGAKLPYVRVGGKVSCPFESTTSIRCCGSRGERPLLLYFAQGRPSYASRLKAWSFCSAAHSSGVGLRGAEEVVLASAKVSRMWLCIICTMLTGSVCRNEISNTLDEGCMLDKETLVRQLGVLNTLHPCKGKAREKDGITGRLP